MALVTDSSEPIGNVTAGALPLLPPTPHNTVPFCVKEKTTRVPMARPGMGSKGKFMKLLTNHFRICVYGGVRLFHHSVSIFYEDGKPVACKGLRRKVISRMKETCDKKLNSVDIFYDGDKCLFSTDGLPHYHQELSVVLETILSNRSNGSTDAKPGYPNENDQKRQRRPCPIKSFKVVITGVGMAEISLRLMAKTLHGEDSEKSTENFRVLDTIMRQHAVEQSCLLVRQSFFNNDPKNFFEVGGGVLGLRGFHSALQTTQKGLTLNLDASTTMIIQPGPVTEFLIHSQNVKDCFSVDWVKAKRSLKNLRIKVNHSNAEYRITGLSEKPCNEQTFFMKQRGSTDDGEPKMLEVTVYDYFKNNLNIELHYSAELPCINVGKPKRPNYIPLELCSLVSLQRYTKALTTSQRSSLVEKSRQEPRERISVIINAFRTINYGAHPVLRSSGFHLRSDFIRVDGRVLEAPKLKFGNGEEMFPINGRWSLINKKLVEPRNMKMWFIVNFSAHCDVPSLVRHLIKCGEILGMHVDTPRFVFEEKPQYRQASALVRVEKMFEDIMATCILRPEIILCLLPEGKNCKIYGPWKKKNLADIGIVTQCMAPTIVNDQILFNVLLKINAKLGGLSSMLVLEHSCSIPIVSEIPTMILGMDVSHGSPGNSDVPSVAAVVSSRQWPSISRYRASVRTQLPRKEVIDSLFKPVGTEDEGILRELLLDFFSTSGKRKPEQIIVFRDGVSESQFNQVLNIELEQMIEACKFLDDSWSPKFVVIVVQKNHHTKFFQTKSPDNVPPGTVIDSQVCHRRNNDFYMCAHAGMIGTTRPAHYHVLFDEIGFSADEVQELVHSLSYVYQRSTTAISVVAPVAYAHLAAAQVAKFMKFEEMSETSASNEGLTRAVAVPVPQLPVLSDWVAGSMFFC